MSEPGVIPPGHYFMTTPHKDSLDSRYKMIGLIDTKRLVGRVTPVM
jgi:conjugal transfer pilin signal peptidase TrbI